MRDIPREADSDILIICLQQILQKIKIQLDTRLINSLLNELPHFVNRITNKNNKQHIVTTKVWPTIRNRTQNLSVVNRLP